MPLEVSPMARPKVLEVVPPRSSQPVRITETPPVPPGGGVSCVAPLPVSWRFLGVPRRSNGYAR